MNTFIRVMRFVGDLDDNFYDDERQRDVWNEASAIGLQLFTWAAMIAAAILAWSLGRTGAWIALGLLLTLTFVGTITLAYSWVRGVNIYTAATPGRIRSFAVGLVLLVGYIGVLVRLQPDIFADADSWTGGIVGGLVVSGFVAWGIRYMRRRNARFENGELD